MALNAFTFELSHSAIAFVNWSDRDQAIPMAMRLADENLALKNKMWKVSHIAFTAADISSRSLSDHARNL